MKFLTQIRVDGVVLGEVVDVSRTVSLEACQIVVNENGGECELYQAPIRAKAWAVYSCIAGQPKPKFIRMEAKTNDN